MHITPYKAHVFSQFHISEKTIKVSHTSLNKLEKEDFNSINRYFISSLVPASALPTWGSIPQIGNTWSIDIHVFVSQGIEPWLTNADAGTRRPQVSLRSWRITVWQFICLIGGRVFNPRQQQDFLL